MTAGMETVQRDLFVGLSAALTGFSAYDLEATTQIEPLAQVLVRIIGAPIVAELLGTYAEIAPAPPPERDRMIRARILADPTLGPVARALIKLWYTGSWYQMPADWRAVHGENPEDVDHVVSSAAYLNGLVWPALAAHPQGGHQPGFASWHLAPAHPAP